MATLQQKDKVMKNSEDKERHSNGPAGYDKKKKTYKM